MAQTASPPDNLAIILGVTLSAAFVLLLIALASFCFTARRKRAERGTYSPNRQEHFGRVEMDYVLKPPPKEGLIWSPSRIQCTETVLFFYKTSSSFFLILLFPAECGGPKMHVFCFFPAALVPLQLLILLLYFFSGLYCMRTSCFVCTTLHVPRMLFFSSITFSCINLFLWLFMPCFGLFSPIFLLCVPFGFGSDRTVLRKV